MVIRARIEGREGKPERTVTAGDLSRAYDPDAAMPDEIVEAKLDGICPRCEAKGDFGDEGLCLKCGFAY